MSIMSASGIWTYLGQARSDRVGISTFDMHLQGIEATSLWMLLRE